MTPGYAALAGTVLALAFARCSDALLRNARTVAATIAPAPRLVLLRSVGEGKTRPMPRSGSMTLSDLRQPWLVIACDKCGRRGSYAVARLRAERGDLMLTDFLAELTATCPKSDAVALYDRCGARFFISDP